VDKKLIYFLICFCAATGFVCGVGLSKIVDILQEIKIANISAVGIITSLALLACIIWCLERLITWKCLRSKILKKDIIDLLLKPTAFVIAFVFICSLMQYLEFHPPYSYGLLFGIVIIGIALLTKDLVKNQRRKNQVFYYKFELIFMLGLAIGLLVELIF